VAQPSDDADREALRAGLRVSLASIVWTVATSSAAVAIGIVTNSLVVIAFGLTGLLDAAASVTLVVHFRHALEHETVSDRHERLALRLVTIGLFVVGLATAGESVHRLLRHPTTESAPVAVVLAAASAVVLVGLAVRKRRVGAAIPSPALVADGFLSLIGALLAAVTVAGTALTSTFGWWWADPTAALGVAGGAVVAAYFVSRE
jgi:divalent metal cation (Fe/Co/Zn/Cd) transporter